MFIIAITRTSITALYNQLVSTYTYQHNNSNTIKYDQEQNTRDVKNATHDYLYIHNCKTVNPIYHFRNLEIMEMKTTYPKRLFWMVIFISIISRFSNTLIENPKKKIRTEWGSDHNLS